MPSLMFLLVGMLCGSKAYSFTLSHQPSLMRPVSQLASAHTSHTSNEVCSDESAQSRRHWLEQLAASGAMLATSGVVLSLPESAHASGGATAGRYTTIPIAKRRYYGRVQQAVHEFLEIGPAFVIKGGADMTSPTVQQFFDPQGTIIVAAKRKDVNGQCTKKDGDCKGREIRDSRWNDMKASMYLLANAFRTDQQKPPDRLQSTKDESEQLARHRKFLSRSFDTAQGSPTPFNFFYLLAKVHKTPWKTRPIVSCSGSLLQGLGRWVDGELQRIVRHLPFYLKSSTDLAFDLAQLGPLPEGTRFFTCDATSMYTNIDTTHALDEIASFLRASPITALENINIEAVIAALQLIMEKNVFCFGDTFWKQISGTAMGTPPAPMYATLYFAIHEDRILRQFPQLRFYRRYIDDGFGIWISKGTRLDHEAWVTFQLQFGQYGKLSWTFSDLLTSIDFLDVTISVDLESRRITTTLFEKALNLYLYLPPHSAHPPGALHGLVAGWFYRLHRLVSCPDERVKLAEKLRSRLWARGFTLEQLAPVFTAAKNRCYEPSSKISVSDAVRPLYLHVRYHPADPSARLIQRLVRRFLTAPKGDVPIARLRNREGFQFGVERIVVAYHRPRNLKNYLSPRQLNPAGTPVSEILQRVTAQTQT